jgi:flagellar secretion chaperone FliS
MNLPTMRLARYGAVRVTTASPGQLVVMLYDGMFRFLRGAAEAMTAGQRAKAGEQGGRARAILEQLLFGLDRSAFPDLCDKLGPLYTFCMGHITRANLHQEPKPLLEVVAILFPLRDAWASAAEQVAAKEANSKGGVG